jgi:hypothetical protein
MAGRFPAPLLLVALAAGMACRAAPAPYRFAHGHSAVVPLHIVAGSYPFVHLTVAGRPAWFLLDSAATGMSVDLALAREAGLALAGHLSARGGGSQVVSGKLAHDLTLELPGLSLHEPAVAAIPLRQLSPAFGFPFDGLLGSDLFRRFVVETDYQHRRMIVHELGHAPAPKDAIAIPVTLDEVSFAYVDARLTLPGRPPVSGRFLVDSGVDGSVVLNRPFVERYRLAAGQALLDVSGTGAGGKTALSVGFGEWLDLGPISIGRPIVTFARDTSGSYADPRYAGLLGSKALCLFDVVYDYPRRRLLLTPSLPPGSRTTEVARRPVHPPTPAR